MALVKGSADDIRYDIGNLIALWLLVPAVIGVRARRVAYALALALVWAVLAIVSYYFVFDGFTFRPWRFVGENRTFFLCVGSVSAGLFGALTCSVVRPRSALKAVPWAMACLAEPFVVPVFGRGNGQRSLVYAGEIACGLAVLLYSAYATVRRKRATLDEHRAINL